MLEEQSDLSDDISEYISIDEPVLLELQNLTHQVTNLDHYGSGTILQFYYLKKLTFFVVITCNLQLAETTRACFRDSLYRLAENSRYQTKCSQIGKENMDRKPLSRVGPSG